jgi:site-specific DNA-methyltransferase (adenine-specific)
MTETRWATAPAPYYADDTVRLYLGDCRELLPALGEEFDAAICDPPYAETSLDWDHWPIGWTQAVAGVTSSMWCFGSMRMFLARASEFSRSDWRLSQDVVWRKNTTGMHAGDRFSRCHESALHWYRDDWASIYHCPPRVRAMKRVVGDLIARGEIGKGRLTGELGAYSVVSDGYAYQRTVIDADSVRAGIHPTEKPISLLTQLIEYAVPPADGVLLDPMAGSCSTAVAARLSGRRAVCIEAHEPYAEAAARRLDQGVLTFDGTEAS